MLAFLGYFYLSFVALTSRIRVNPASEDSINALREGRPVVFTFWFQNISFLLYYFGVRRMPILMTPQGKTDRVTRLSEWMGLRVAKGSLEGGGRHALVTLLEQVKNGSPVALAADGSRGPERKCKAGCFILAQEAGVPIIPVTWKAALRIKIPRRHGAIYFPLPFNSIEVKFGSTVVVSKHYQFAELEGVKNQLATMLDRLNE
jgi:lysophospholipid acyltransferase (LPLAT)-like uncharacterized protein